MFNPKNIVMTEQLFNAIADGAPGISVTITAADLMKIVQAIFSKEAERTAEAIEAAKEIPSLTRMEAAKMLRVSYATLWRWGKEGYLKPIKIGSKTLYRKSDVDKLLSMDFGKGAVAQ